jgi:hypothetical protein
MRLFLITLFLLAALSSYGDDKSNAMTNAPTIKIDEEHRMNNRPESVKSAIYFIHSAPGIVIDATGYKFDVLVGLEGKPLNSIQIIQDKTHQFVLGWETGKTRYELSKETLHPEKQRC